MPADKFITTSTNEFEFGRIISQRTVFAIPYFQREYVWNKSNLDDFQNDLDGLEDHQSNIVFLGAIILYQRPEIQSTQATFYDVIDGQQRIITLSLYIIAIANKYIQMREYDRAAEILQTIINPGRTNLSSNFKIYPCGQDIRQFNNILKPLFDNPSLKEALGITPRYLPDSGSVRGKLSSQYTRIKKIIEKYNGSEGLDLLMNNITAKVNFVQLDLNEPNDATSVFERLNFRGQKVTVGDLVRNEIFVDSYSTPLDELTLVYEQQWMPFYERFGSNGKDFESFLFASSLIHEPTINKSGIYSLLRDKWENLSTPIEKIGFLRYYLEEFCEIKYGNSSKEFPQKIKKSLKNLRRAKVADVVHPFLMKILYENSVGNIDTNLIVKVINLIESYVVRRGLCGHEQTGMYKIFVSLWRKTKDDFKLKTIRKVIASYTTQPWPTNDELKVGLTKAKVDKARVLYHVLNELEHSLGGDIPANNFTIEHILPRTPNDNYPDYDEDQIENYTRTLANLIPISGEINSSIQNSPYSEKRGRFLKDSMYKTPRELARRFQTWTPEDVGKRSEYLFEWVKNRWKY